MQIIRFCSIISITLIIAEGTVSAQQQSPPGANAIFQRIMTFDANKDGHLDKSELKKLQADLTTRGIGGPPTGVGRPGTFNGAPGGGFGGRPGGGGPFGAGGPFGGRLFPFPGALEGVVDNMELSPMKTDQAASILVGYKTNVEKRMNENTARLVADLRKVLSKSEMIKLLGAVPVLRPGEVLGDRGGPPRLGLRPDEIVAHFMSFDKNKDGKVAKDEVHERMHGLIAKFDVNEDNSLDVNELKKGAKGLGGNTSFRGFGGAPFGPGASAPGGGIDGILGSLGISSQEKRDKAKAIIVESQDKHLPELLDKSRDELELGMKKVLNNSEYALFLKGLDDLSGSVTPANNSPTTTNTERGAGRPAGGGMPSVDVIFGNFDGNKDGQLSESEVPGPMWQRLSAADKNKDGKVSKNEFSTILGSAGGRRP